MTDKALAILAMEEINSPLTEAFAAVCRDLDKINANAAALMDQSRAAVVEDDDSLAKAGDLVKVARANKERADNLRKAIVKEPNAFVKKVNGLFKPTIVTIESAKAGLERKMGVFLREREAEERRKAEEKRKALEERALAAAEEAKSIGDDVGAEIILDTGVDATEEIREEKTKVYGDYGATTSTRKVVTGQVADIAEFLEWVAASIKAGKLPVPVNALIDVKQGALNRIAKELDDNGTQSSVPGFIVNVETKANVR